MMIPEDKTHTLNSVMNLASVELSKVWHDFCPGFEMWCITVIILMIIRI